MQPFLRRTQKRNIIPEKVGKFPEKIVTPNGCQVHLLLAHFLATLPTKTVTNKLVDIISRPDF
jgi:hypothetical protein